MNTKLAIPFLALLVAAQGCIIHGGGRSPGDVTFSWTFLGQACSTAGVDSVHISIPGETLDNNGYYSCISNGYPGIVLHDFAGGQYTYSIEGLDPGGYTIYTATGDFTIDGDVLETVDLTPYGQPASYGLVAWRFPDDRTCAQADTPQGYFGGVASVDITMEGSTIRVSCASGSVAASSPGVQSQLVAPGTHDVTVTALSSSNYPLFTYSGTMTTYAGNPVSNTVDLQWAVGGLMVGWTLQSPTGATQACTVPSDPTKPTEPYVYVQFVNPVTNTGLYAAPGDPNECTASPVKYYYLPAGSGGSGYNLVMSASDPTGAITWSQVGGPAAVTVMPGVFPTTSPVNVVLRQN
ncbi:MAG TPA: hypothetical protein VND93_14470 [Myxococcales bacterium]|nr:hypothetical protein [Myxococcales bacterium]